METENQTPEEKEREKVKRQAMRLKEFLQAKGGTIKLGSCYEIIARMYGYPSWNILSALINNGRAKAVTYDFNQEQIDLLIQSAHRLQSIRDDKTLLADLKVWKEVDKVKETIVAILSKVLNEAGEQIGEE